MDNIDMLINELESELMKAKKSAFSSSLVVVDKMNILNLVARLRASLPPVIREATAIKNDRDSIMHQADEYSQKLIEDAQTRAAQLVSETEIMTKATADAEAMLKEADENYHKMDYDARYCAFKILEESERVLNESIDKINENKRKLAND